MLTAMPVSDRKNMSFPLTGVGLMMRWTASATRTPVTAQLHSTDARAAKTSTRWYLCATDLAMIQCSCADTVQV